MKKTINTKLIESAGKPSKRITYTDASLRNLMVFIETSGNVYWIWQGKVNGKTRQVRLGRYPQMGVAAARQAATELTDNRDAAKFEQASLALPRIRPSKAEPIVAIFAEEPTTAGKKDMDWLWSEYMKRDCVGQASAKEKQRCWDRDLKPEIGDIPYDELTYDDVADVIAEIAEDRPSHANHLVSYIKRCLRWAVTKGRPFTKLKEDPIRDLVKPSDVSSRSRALSEQEIGWFFRTVEAFDDRDGFASALTLLLYNGNRRSEIFRMPWSEYAEKTGIWTIPGERTKNGDPLLLPLAETSRSILKARREATKGRSYVFTASKGDKPFNQFSKRLQAFRESFEAIAKKEMGKDYVVENWTIHDLRRTLSTGMNGLVNDEGDPLISGEIVERVLNHRLGKIAGTYNLHDYKAEKRRALELWDARLTEIRNRALQS